MMDDTRERIDVGRYRVIGEPGLYRVMEGFGSYRMLKKKFRTRDAAVKRAEEMDAAKTEGERA